MNTIIFYITHNEDPEEIYLKHQNSRIFYKIENDHFYFRSHYNEISERIIVKREYIKYDEILMQDMIKLFDKSNKVYLEIITWIKNNSIIGLNCQKKINYENQRK